MFTTNRRASRKEKGEMKRFCSGYMYRQLHVGYRLAASYSTSSSISESTFSNLPTPTNSLTEVSAMAEYRRYCSEQSLPQSGGVPLHSFVSYISELRGDESKDNIQETLQAMPCFQFNENGRILLEQKEGNFGEMGVSQFQTAFQSLAATLPLEGVTSFRIKTLIDESIPHFSPTAVGVLTLKEALALYPQCFSVEDGEKRGNKSWTVKPVRSQQTTSAPPQPPTPRVFRSPFELHFRKALMLIKDEQRLSPSQWVDVGLVLNRMRRQYQNRKKQTREVTAISFVPSLFEAPKGESENQCWLRLTQNCKTVESKSKIIVRKKLIPRAAHVFVDGDAISKEDVEKICMRVKIMMPQSTLVVARQGGSRLHSESDIVAPYQIQTYMLLEKEAEKLQMSTTVVLRDVVYICAGNQLDFYRQNVAKAVPFLDANVYVITPTREVLVARRSDGFPMSPS